MVVYKSQNSRYRKDLLFLDATDRVSVRTGVAVQVDAATEDMEVGDVEVVNRAGRPI